jgi:hypothetical protein
MTIAELNEPKEWIKQGDWGSHLPLLHLALTKTTGAVVELGSGLISTPLLRKYCLENKREFYSFDANKEWAEKTQSHWIEDWHTTEDWVIHCGLVLVDESPGEHRRISIEVYSKIADALVVHDTEVGAEYVYGMSDILSKCKYRLDYQSDSYPRTTLVSNKFNVTEWR